ncbi:uncharacterized protein BKA55DRAFT_682842 [Fusarium redolens]|uniref:Uncharacterized protein n=1 Tax=Fusarium redolens TaxID=48865 RepID=A0A9P9KWC2_FUSRE|nr:uncharacterized protein BKA55DRAFT_682842 [Fusarium redolens]KAH7269762.1 hypothetical protein BKA55DRAFT_682842 [Fusarium redolens]
MSVMLSLIASRQKKKLKELQFVRQKASKYQAIVHTAQAQALASQLKVENYEKENLRLSTAVEQWRRSYVELANNHHNSTRPSQYPSSPTKELTKHVQIVPPTNWQKPGNSPLRHVESVSPVSSTATSEYEGFSESAPPSDGYCGSDDQSFTARTERMMAEIRAEQDASNRVADKPPQIPASSLSF